jgi:hypothetical protein
MSRRRRLHRPLCGALNFFQEFIQETLMTDKENFRLKSLPVANYNSAVARAVAWLGNRYLLAKPINAAPGRSTLEAPRN